MTTQQSNYAEHTLSTNHSYTDINTNMKILEIENKGEKMNVREEFNIYVHNLQDKDNMLNSTHTQIKNPIYETIQQLRTRPLH